MSNGFISFLYFIGIDKYIHFLACLLINLLIFAVGHAFRLGPWIAGVAFLVPVIVGFIKEKVDQKKKNNGQFDHMDFVADFLGSFTGLIFAAIILI